MKGERETEKGFVLWDGEIITPPFTVRRVADKVLLNEKQVFPFPELVEEVEEPSFEAIPQDVTFAVDVKVQEAVTGAIDESKTFDPFFSFEEKAHRMTEYLDYKEVKAVRTPEYGDLVVPVNDEWGIVVAPNIGARVQIGREAEALVTKRPIPYDVAAEFAEYFMGVLEVGGMLTLDKGIFSVTPPDEAETKLGNLKSIGISDVSDEEKADRMTTFMSLPRSSGKRMLDTIQQVEVEPAEEGFSQANPRVVSFFPHLSWQKEVFGRHSNWCINLIKFLYSCCGYHSYRFYYDAQVTLKNWAYELWNADKWGTRVIYNIGHGNRNTICMGTPDPKKGPWHYFNDAFVTKYAEPGLPRTLVEAFSCYTLADNRLATAFLRRGACAYLGWLTGAPANPNYDDQFDEILWKTLIGVRSTAGYAVEELYHRGIVTPDKFQLRGDWCCRVC